MADLEPELSEGQLGEGEGTNTEENAENTAPETDEAVDGALDLKNMELSLLQVAEKNLLELVDGCLLRGDELEMVDEKGTTPLMAATAQGHEEMVELLLSRAAYPSARKHNGETALHIASRAGNRGLAQMLIAHGAQIEVDTEGRNRPLHLAAQANHEEVVHLLLERGAQVQIKNDASQTPLMVTTSNTIKNQLQTVQAGGEGQRARLRQDVAEGEVVRLAQQRKAKQARQEAEAQRLQEEHMNKIKAELDRENSLKEGKANLIADINFLKAEVARFQAEEAERERLAEEEAERLAREAEKAKKKGKKGKKK